MSPLWGEGVRRRGHPHHHILLFCKIENGANIFKISADDLMRKSFLKIPFNANEMCIMVFRGGGGGVTAKILYLAFS